MKVVTCYKAAQIAGVSRQAIQSLKNINVDQKSKYPFFCFDPITGKFGIDIENREWINYLDRNKNHHARKNKQIDNTGSKVNRSENGKTSGENNTKLLDTIVGSVVSAIKEVIKPDQKTMKRLFAAIDRNLEGKL